MSNPFMFGVGSGRITKAEIVRREKAAEQHGAEFTVTTGRHGHCECGRGCRLDACKIKHWFFSAPNQGEPFNSQLASAVNAEIA